MTTDITELAQSLKAAAEKAKHAGEAPIMSFYARISALNEYQITVCPDNVLALVEALEKAQETIAFQQGEIKALLSSLDSRTVTVKLPQAVSAGGQGYQEQVERILTAAGIKVEAE